MTYDLSRFHPGDLELDVLGAAVRVPGAFVEAWDAGLRDVHMGYPFASVVWRACERLFSSGEEIDTTSVLCELTPEDLDEIGGRDRLFSLATDDRYSNLAVPRKARRLIELAKIRETFGRIAQVAEEKRFKASAKYLAEELQALSLELLSSQRAAALITGDEAGERARTRAQEFAAMSATRFDAEGRPMAAFPGTGWPGYDRLLGGMRPGHTYGFAAHEKAGKTMAAMQMLEENSILGRPGLFLGLESPPIEMAERLHGWEEEELAARTAQGRYDARTVELMVRAAALHDAKTRNIVYANDLRADRRSIQAAYIRAIQQHKIEFAVLDYIGLVEPRRGTRANATEELNDLSRWLKLLAGEHGPPILVLSQYNRNAFQREDKAPRANDVYGGGALARDCAALTLMESPYLTDPDKPKSEVTFHIVRNRFGLTGSVAMGRSNVGTFHEIGIIPGSVQ